MKKIYLLLLISILILVGCSKNNQIPMVSLEKANPVSITSDLTKEFYDLLNSGATTSQLGDFLTNNIVAIDEVNTPIIVSEIIKLSTYEKAILSGKVYTFQNMATTYAGTFNYIWDVNKIDSLEDSDLKVFLQELARSYYKISTHKNYIDVDLDYNRLGKLDNLSDELISFIDINQTKRTLLLNASIQGEMDYNALRDNIMKLESFLIDYPDSDLTFEAESLYKSLISMFFIGSDGLDPFDYDNKKFKQTFFNTLLETSLNYPMTMFSEICTEFLNKIDNKNEYKSMDYVSLISNYRKMGLKNKNSILAVVSEKSEFSNIIYPQFSSFEDKSVQQTLNDKIKKEIEAIKSNLNWKEDANTKYNISYFVNYGSYKYISLQLTGSSYNRETKLNSTIQTNLNFDVKTGDVIELSDLLGQSFDDYKTTFTEMIKTSGDIDSAKLSSFKTLTEQPQFMISNLSLVLYFEKGQYNFDDKYPVYVYISQNKLKNILNFRELYK